MGLFPAAILLLCVIVCVLAPGRAEAYLDAGTGSAIIQFVIAGVVGILFVLKMFWRKIRSAIARLFSRKAQDAEPEQ